MLIKVQLEVSEGLKPLYLDSFYMHSCDLSESEGHTLSHAMARRSSVVETHSPVHLFWSHHGYWARNGPKLCSIRGSFGRGNSLGTIMADMGERDKEKRWDTRETLGSGHG